MAGSSQFVPSLNAITTNQDLQWLVQPALMHPPGPVPPYPALLGTRPPGQSHSQSHFLRPGVIRAAANSPPSTRRRNDEQVRRASFWKVLMFLFFKNQCLYSTSLRTEADEDALKDSVLSVVCKYPVILREMSTVHNFLLTVRQHQGLLYIYTLMQVIFFISGS